MRVYPGLAKYFSKAAPSAVARMADERVNYAASGIFREMTLEIPGRSMVTP
jgi:hypothetical protein